MVNNQNAKITKEVERAFGLNNLTGYPQQVSSAILPVVEVNPKYINVIKSITATNATGASIYTTPTNKDFYLCTAQLTMIKDVTATSTFSNLYATPDNIDGGTVNIQLLQINGFTLTPQNDSIAITLVPPMKIKRGSIIGINNSTNVANVTSTGCIAGYLIDETGN